MLSCNVPRFLVVEYSEYILAQLDGKRVHE